MINVARLPRRDATANPPACLIPFFEALNDYSGPIPIEDLEREVSKVKITADDLGDAIQIDTGAYVRTLVFERDNVEALVMAWLPGQRSPIHDHAGSGCAVRIVSGRALERIYTKRPDGLVIEQSARQYEPGQVVCSVDEDIHALGNAQDCPASPKSILVTLHVYSPPLAPTRKYTEAT